ncbi:MAG: lipid-A-disaccharide synthase [Anditalea sp.]
MRYYLIAGERSGDLHAANLIHSIKALDSHAVFRGMGGDYMEAEGQTLAVHYDKLALMGFVEVLFGFRKLLKTLSLIKKDLIDFKPEALILVDYGGFNMKLAKFAKEKAIPVHYYIPPKVWAWNQKRGLTLKKNVDQLYSILPFERDFYQRFDWDINYVGNPLLDEIKKFHPHEFFHQKNGLSYSPIIALLPGSRKQEVSKMLDIMVEIVPQYEYSQFVIAGVRNLDAVVYDKAEKVGIKVIYDQTYDLLHHANAAIVTSGTATLETALFRVPQVVVYKTSRFSYQIAKRLIRVPYISLVNLIAGKEVVKELIQDDYNVKNLMSELNAIVGYVQHKAKILDGYTDVREKLGDQMASDETARLIVDSLK